jgi:hypothetical protein
VILSDTKNELRRAPAHEPALVSAFDGLARQLWHRLPNARVDTDDVLLATRGFDLGLSERCPALDDEQRCSLHDLGKPAICRVVPLDALVPDRAQHLLLQGRGSEARYFGSDCIQPGVRPGFDLITRRLSVVDSAASAALADRRRDLALERRTWGDAVFELLQADLFATPAALERLPRDGFMTLSIVPVLMILARHSALPVRCRQYLAAQARLADRLLERARSAGHGELASVQQLTAFARSNAALALKLKE